jgi:hypothetical protein
MNERGLLEKYLAWKEKRLETFADTNIINLFQTEPTQEQLILMNKIIRRSENKWLLIAVTYLLGGVLVGFGWAIFVFLNGSMI